MGLRDLCCLVALSWITATAHAAAQGPPPARVIVDAARFQVIEQRRPVTGQLVAARRSVVATQEEGIVIEVSVREGDAVKVGQVVARLDSARATISLAQAEANEAATAALVRQRDAALGQAQRDLARFESAADQRSASQQETDNARSIRDEALAALEQAKALSASAEQSVAFATKRLDDLSITAPFAGVVVTKRTELGQWLDSGDAVIELVDLDSIEAVLDVPERFIDRLSRETANAQVRIIAIDEVIKAPITRIIPVAEGVARMFPVRVALTNESRRLRPGMSVTGFIPTGSHAETLTVHKDAIMRDTGGEFVFYDNNGRAATARVRILFGAGARVAITSSQLTGGARVVVEGNELLSPGQPLTILKALENNRAGDKEPSDAPSANAKGGG